MTRNHPPPPSRVKWSAPKLKQNNGMRSLRRRMSQSSLGPGKICAKVCVVILGFIASKVIPNGSFTLLECFMNHKGAMYEYCIHCLLQIKLL